MSSILPPYPYPYHNYIIFFEEKFFTDEIYNILCKNRRRKPDKDCWTHLVYIKDTWKTITVVVLNNDIVKKIIPLIPQYEILLSNLFFTINEEISLYKDFLNKEAV